MRGGRSLALETLHLPRPIAQIRKTPPETVAALDQLLNTHTDEAAARELNRMGHRNWKGEPYTAKRLRSTRRVYGFREAVAPSTSSSMQPDVASQTPCASSQDMSDRGEPPPSLLSGAVCGCQGPAITHGPGSATPPSSVSDP